MQVYISHRTPGAEPGETIAWEAVCHSREPFIWIDHRPLHSTGRWSSEPRLRPFMVEIFRRGRFGPHVAPVSSHKTLIAARASAYAWKE
jgi:hypothetical protein